MQGEIEVREESHRACAMEFTVGEEHLALHLKERGRRVLSTPCLVLMMEVTARTCLDLALPAGKTSVGYRVDVRHRKSVGEGEKVRVEARLVSFDGRRALFYVTAYNRGEVVGEAIHERYVVD